MKDYKKLLFNIDIPSGHAPAEGRLLVAEPFLHEAWFDHAVILLADYAKDGPAMGIVLNNPTEYHLQDLIEDIRVKTPVTVHAGGPVSDNQLYFLHTLGPDLIPKANPIAPGLWLGGDFDAMRAIINDGYDTTGHIRFFIGYSGWGDGQLDSEIANNVWAVTQAPPPEQMLTATGDSFWHSTVRSMGPDYRGWLFHPRNAKAN